MCLFDLWKPSFSSKDTACAYEYKNLRFIIFFIKAVIFIIYQNIHKKNQNLNINFNSGRLEDKTWRSKK